MLARPVKTVLLDTLAFKEVHILVCASVVIVMVIRHNATLPTGPVSTASTTLKVTIVNVVPQALLEMLAVELRMIVNQHKLARHANATITVLEDATLSVGA